MMTDSATREFSEGDLVMLVDHKLRRHVQRLTQDGSYHSHSGVVAHSDIIGRPDGVELLTTRNMKFVAWRPTLTDYIFTMKRGAQIIYPKDLGTIALAADLRPGLKILESGVGSGALSLVILNGLAGTGTLHGYELREDFARRAQSNVEGWFGPCDNYQVELRDIYDGIDVVGLDRVLLDLPEPWQALPHISAALVPGGVLVSYLPTINQTATLRASMEHAPFAEVRTFEVLHRGWHIEGQSVRPDHRMVAHTGFLTVARRTAQ